jgi:hypothetical protein
MTAAKARNLIRKKQHLIPLQRQNREKRFLAAYRLLRHGSKSFGIYWIIIPKPSSHKE